jgi:hypothetical protein
MSCECYRAVVFTPKKLYVSKQGSFGCVFFVTQVQYLGDRKFFLPPESILVRVHVCIVLLCLRHDGLRRSGKRDDSLVQNLVQCNADRFFVCQNIRHELCYFASSSDVLFVCDNDKLVIGAMINLVLDIVECPETKLLFKIKHDLRLLLCCDNLSLNQIINR